MRTVATGFLVGYLTVSLLIAPTLLWALQVAPSYQSGVVLVLERTGVLAPVMDAVHSANVARDRMMTQFSNYVSSKLALRLPG